MARRKQTRPRGPKRDIAAEVTGKIVAALENGAAPWVKPWNADSSTPVNATTERRYNGVNVLLLYIAALDRGFSRMRWCTYNQAKGQSAQVRRGEKGTMITLWKPIQRKTETKDGEEKKRGGLLLRHFTVFNVDQIDGLPEEMVTGPPRRILPEATRIAKAESFFEDIGAEVIHGGAKACYIPSADAIRMPVYADFEDAHNYYATMGHEHVHWTAPKKRLDRSEGLSNRFGSEAYAMEELVAELGAAFLCAELGIDGQLQHPEYIASWLKALKGDKRAIFTAASKAKQAVRFLLEAGGLAEPEPDKAGE